jgi:AAA domain
MLLEPDRDQLEIFADALLRYAGNNGFVSVRAFYEDDAGAPFRVTPTSLKGGLKFLLDVVEDDARRAAQAPKAVVFCPPLAVFANKDHAREQDITAGLALSVECDAHPQQARQTLEALLGPATVVVHSGGIWTNGNGVAEDKLHLHWRLARLAHDTDITKLKQARILAARLVGGDPSNAPINHPIRWPGSWHRKADPRLCAIETANPDNEIELDSALKILNKAAPTANNDTADTTNTGNADDWSGLVADIISGKSYHQPLVSLAARLIGSNAHDGTTVKLLRGIMAASTGPRDQRWHSRYDAIARYVNSARSKYAGSNASSTATLHSVRAAGVTMTSVDWLWPNRFAIGKLGIVAGLPDEGKGQVLCDIAARVTRSREWPCSEGRAPRGKVILLTAEDDLADTVVPRLTAADADLDCIEIIKMVHDGNGDRMFSLLTDPQLLRQKIIEVATAWPLVSCLQRRWSSRRSVSMARVSGRERRLGPW